MLRKLFNWFRRLFWKKQPPPKPGERLKDNYSYEFVDDVPDVVESNIVYLIQNEGYCWQSVMECPCGCKVALFMNHVEDSHPHWSYKIDKFDKISLHPSVDRMVGCKSHFWIRGGKIVWA